MFFKKIFGILSEKKVSENTDTHVVKFERKKADPIESNTDDSRLADGYDDAVHNTHNLKEDAEDLSAAHMTAPAELEILNTDDAEINALSAFPDRDELFDQGSRVMPAPRAVIETSWTGAPEEGAVVEFEDEDSASEDVVEELEKMTSSDHAVANEADFTRRHPMAAKTVDL